MNRTRASKSDSGQMPIVHQQIDSTTLDKIRILAEAHQTTVFCVLLTTLKCLLWKYNYEEDVVVGSVTFGRVSTADRTQIGQFTNTLVLKTALSGNPAFYEALSRVSNTVRQGIRHSSLPLYEVVRELNPHRQNQQSGLFNILFSMQDFSSLWKDAPGNLTDR